MIVSAVKDISVVLYPVQIFWLPFIMAVSFISMPIVQIR